jgi:hypothetical protein
MPFLNPNKTSSNAYFGGAFGCLILAGILLLNDGNMGSSYSGRGLIQILQVISAFVGTLNTTLILVLLMLLLVLKGFQKRNSNERHVK